MYIKQLLQFKALGSLPLGPFCKYQGDQQKVFPVHALAFLTWQSGSCRTLRLAVARPCLCLSLLHAVGTGLQDRRAPTPPSRLRRSGLRPLVATEVNAARLEEGGSLATDFLLGT